MLFRLYIDYCRKFLPVGRIKYLPCILGKLKPWIIRIKKDAIPSSFPSGQKNPNSVMTVINHPPPTTHHPPPTTSSFPRTRESSARQRFWLEISSIVHQCWRCSRTTGSPACAGDDEGNGNVNLTFFDTLEDANSNVIFISFLTY